MRQNYNTRMILKIKSSSVIGTAPDVVEFNQIYNQTIRFLGLVSKYHQQSHVLGKELWKDYSIFHIPKPTKQSNLEPNDICHYHASILLISLTSSLQVLYYYSLQLTKVGNFFYPSKHVNSICQSSLRSSSLIFQSSDLFSKLL